VELDRDWNGNGNVMGIGTTSVWKMLTNQSQFDHFIANETVLRCYFDKLYK
jgi:hypothetical protein